jgi:hypothetical protein
VCDVLSEFSTVTPLCLLVTTEEDGHTTHRPITVLILEIYVEEYLTRRLHQLISW